MNPAWSVIVFTTVAGAAQGLVLALALARLAGQGFAVQALALPVALVLLAVGLGSSFLHLGRPERAWRAAAMWRTSWLSREVIVLPAFGAAVALWWALGDRMPAAWLVGVVALALLLWLCTAMIYACLRFVAEWAHPLTVLNYALIGLASGMLLLVALAAASGDRRALQAFAPTALFAVAAAAMSRAVSLVRNERLRPRSTSASATGIPGEPLRQLSMGMTAGAFNTREFFHGRGPATLAAVKALFVGAGFAMPALLLVWGLTGGPAWAFVAALAIHAPGVMAERWYFFAEARHPQNLYYQRAS